MTCDLGKQLGSGGRFEPLITAGRSSIRKRLGILLGCALRSPAPNLLLCPACSAASAPTGTRWKDAEWILTLTGEGWQGGYAFFDFYQPRSRTGHIARR